MHKALAIIILCLMTLGIGFANRPDMLQPINVWVPDTFANPGATISIPIMTDDVTGHDVIACQATITYRSDLLTATGATVGSIVPSGWLIQPNISSGQIIIAMAGSTALSGSGDLFWIQFTVAGGATLGDTTTIHFGDFMYNEGEPAANPIDGLFTVGAPQPPVHDVGVTAINAPTGTINEGATVTPNVTVENFGDQTETFDVTFMFGSYSDTQTVTDLAAGATAPVNFADWTAVVGTYNTMSYTMLVGDEDMSNDTAYGSFEVVSVPVHDVGVTAINAPTGTINEGATVTPNVTVENFGNQTETFDVTFTFGTYSSTQTVTDLAAGATAPVNFADWTAVVGSYNTTSYTALAGDQDMSNDTAYGSFEVVELPVHDVGVISILAPTGTITAGTSVTPSVTVENFGNQTETFDVTFTFATYSNTQTVTDLAAGATTTVNFADWTAVVGSYNTTSYTALAGDQDMSNDTAYGSFEVVSVPVHDVGVTAILAPVGTIIEGTTVTPSSVVENFGTETETFSVVFNIATAFIANQVNPGSSPNVVNRNRSLMDAQVYTDTVDMTLPAGGTQTVSFADWVAVVGTYNTISLTILNGDEDPSNDTTEGSFEVVALPVHDVGVTAINAPAGTINEGATVTPNVTVENFGNQTETFDVTFTFGTYSNTQTVEDLAAGATAPVNFADWTAVVGSYNTTSYTALAGDQDMSNDTAYGSFEVVSVPVHDVGVTAILAPVGTIIEGATVTPSVTVENFGNQTETFDVTFTFGTYSNTQTVEDLAAGATTTVNFADWTAVVGSYNTTSYTALAGDQDMSNDTAYGSFEVVAAPIHDVGVTAILAPTGTILAGTLVTPSVTVENFGNQTETFPVTFEFTGYSNTQTFTDLAPGATVTVNFNQWTAVIGAYNTMSYTMLVGDEDMSNDTAYGSFEVVSAGQVHDVGVVEIIEPVGTINAGAVVTPTAVIQNFGNFEETFACYFAIGCAYFDWTVITLPAGAVDTIVFAPWTAQTGYYNEAAETGLENDENHTNDLILLWLTVNPPPNPQGYTVAAPLSFALAKPYPNPARENLALRFSIPRTAKVDIAIYDINGRTVKTLLSETKTAGIHNLNVNCQDIPNGAYILRLNADNYTAIEKFTVTK